MPQVSNHPINIQGDQGIISCALLTLCLVYYFGCLYKPKILEIPAKKKKEFPMQFFELPDILSTFVRCIVNTQNFTKFVVQK